LIFFKKYKALYTFYLLILIIDDILFDFSDFKLFNDELKLKLSLINNFNEDKEKKEDE